MPSTSSLPFRSLTTRHPRAVARLEQAVLELAADLKAANTNREAAPPIKETVKSE